jgi:integrase
MSSLHFVPLIGTTSARPVVNDRTPITSRPSRRRTPAAGLPGPTGALHILRHTFCSHLAVGGAPAKAIQELAGHEDLTTTLRYMHLSPAAREGAIAVLNRRGAGETFGDILEKTAP